MLKIYRRATLRALNLPHLCTHSLQFQRRQAAYELLLAQKLVERRKPAVARSAAKLGESAGRAHVKTRRQRSGAARAFESAADRPRLRVASGLDFPEQFNCRDGRQLNTGEMVEPDTRAADAQFDPDLDLIVLVQVPNLHGFPAVGTGHLGTGDGECHTRLAER